MLKRLLVSNLTVIDRAEIEFHPGLVAVTGETGAGKTMLTQAVRLVAGEKAVPSLVGPRRSEAYVEAEFDDDIPEAAADIADVDEPFVLARRLRADGPARALISGRSTNAAQLRDSAASLLSLTGQHAAQELVKASTQLDLLDQAGKHQTQKTTVATKWNQLKQTQKELQELRKALADRLTREEMLRAEVSLVDDVQPIIGEEQQLEAELARLQHVEDLRNATAHSVESLIDSDDALVDQIARLSVQINEAAEHDQRLVEISQNLDSAYEALTDAGRLSRTFVDAYDHDPERLSEVQLRLSDLHDLRRRFSHQTIEDIIERVNKSRAELAAYENGDSRLQELIEEEERAALAYKRAADKLSECRKKTARQLQRDVETHLHDLALIGARFLVHFETATPTVNGTDKVVFLLAANKGMQPATLDDGASGGELSRVNLALLLAVAPDHGTFIFDEVDAGIGGKTAHEVAAKLQALSKTTQVIVITHLAQIAAVADQHYILEKREREDVVQTQVKELDERQKVFELARLMGTDTSTYETAATAVDALKAGNENNKQ